MPTEILEPKISDPYKPGTIDLPNDDRKFDDNDLDQEDTGEAPPIFGRCPVCGKPLFPRDKITGQMKAPPVGRGYDSRAKCGGCGYILFYKGSGEWGILSDNDLTDDDRFADKLGM